MTWSFSIPIAIPSGNTLRRRYRNPFAYQRLRGDYAWLIKANSGGIPPATGPRKASITRIIGTSGRLYDYDNLVAGAKPMLDMLVKAGLLLGDAPHQVTVEYGQERVSGPSPMTRVTLEDA